MSATAKLVQALTEGATIVCSRAPYEGWAVHHDPRTPKDRAPWALPGSPFRYNGDEVHAVTKGPDCRTCEGSGGECEDCDGRGFEWATWEYTARPRKLGKDQAGVLRNLRDHGSWDEGCGWVWGTRSRTKLILDSLVRRGLVDLTVPYEGAAPRYVPSPPRYVPEV